jgi:hypothetical protein
MVKMNNICMKSLFTFLILILPACGGKSLYSDLGEKGKDSGTDVQKEAVEEINSSGDTVSFEEITALEETVESECNPDCYGKECGDNSCGGICGSCTEDKVCENGMCVTPKTDCTTEACSKGYYCNLVTKKCVKGCLIDEHCGEYQECDKANEECVCKSGYHFCGAACVTDNNIEHCGTSCSPCNPPANSKATCDGKKCGQICNEGFCGSSCKKCNPPPNSKAVCKGEECGYMCNSGYFDCNNSCYSKTDFCKGVCGKNYGFTCNKNEDCCSGYECINKKCLKKTGNSCTDSDECEGNGKCQSDKCCLQIPSEGCSSDSDCCSNTCRSGSCILSPGSTCSKSGDCGTGMDCLNNKCCVQANQLDCTADDECCGYKEETIANTICSSSKKCASCIYNSQWGCKNSNDCCSIGAQIFQYGELVWMFWTPSCYEGKCCAGYNIYCDNSSDCCSGYTCKNANYYWRCQ